MKKLFKFCLLLTLSSITTFSQLQAQDAAKELAGFTKKFQDAYNKKDDKTLKTFYTTDATRTDASGSTISGNEAIVAEFATLWASSKVTIVIRQDKAETQADGSTVATGTYLLTGKTNAGESIDVSGTYTNTVVKEGGKWKISKSVLGSL